MLRYVVITVLIAGLMSAFGCSGFPTVPSESKDMEAFFSGVSPNLTGIVGQYTFTGRDGTVETGTIVANEAGLTLVSDRGSSTYSNCWFSVDTEYLNPRYYSGAGLPVYYLGDTLQYRVKIDYKKGLPLDLYPLLYAKVTAEQRYWPTLTPLPGDWQQTWDPVNIPPFASIQLDDTYYIPSSVIPGNDCTASAIYLEFWFGCFEFRVAHGICGMWDP